MKKILFSCLLLSGFLLTACNEKTYTVDEFTANKDLLNEYRSKCQNGELNGDSLNCQNSQKALIKLNRVTNASWD